MRSRGMFNFVKMPYILFHFYNNNFTRCMLSIVQHFDFLIEKFFWGLLHYISWIYPFFPLIGNNLLRDLWSYMINKCATYIHLGDYVGGIMIFKLVLSAWERSWWYFNIEFLPWTIEGIQERFCLYYEGNIHENRVGIIIKMLCGKTIHYFFCWSMDVLNIKVGVAEMKVAVERTGGLVVLAESFGHSVFKDSFKRIFEDGEQSLGLCFKWVFYHFKCCTDFFFLFNFSLFWPFAFSLMLHYPLTASHLFIWLLVCQFS